MAIVSVGQFQFPIQVLGSANVFTGFTLNAAGDKLGFVLRVPKSGTLDWFEFRVGTVSDNPNNGLRLSFQDISLVDGFPDGSVDQFVVEAGPFSSNTWITPSAVMTDDGTPGGVKRVVVAGDLLGCVVDFSSFVAGDSIGISALSLSDSVFDTFYTANGVTGTYAKALNPPTLALKYNDGTYAEFPLGISPILTIVTHSTFNTGSTPDEIALRFKVPVSMRIVGAWVRADDEGDADIILYDVADNILASTSIDPNVRAQTGIGVSFVYFDTPITLLANTEYRLSVLPTSATNLIIYSFTLNSAALMAAVNGGVELYSSVRTDAGAWTDDTAIRPIMGLVIDGIDVAAGGGSEHSFVS